MPMIYESPNGRIYMGWLGGYSAQTAQWPVKRPLPPWLKSRTTMLFTELKACGFDASKDARASAVLWEYVLDCMSYCQLGLDAAAETETVTEILGDMLEQLHGRFD